MPGQLPTTPAFATLGFGSDDPSMISEAWSGRIVARKTAAQKWRVTARYPELKRHEMRALIAFLNKQRGQYHTWTLTIDGESDPDGVASGVPVVRNRENGFLHSEDFSNAAWHKGAVTIGVDAAAGPFGGSTAEQVTAVGSALSFVYQNIDATAGQDYAVSVYAKQGSTSRFFIAAGSSLWTDPTVAQFDLNTGAKVVGTSLDRIDFVGNGWFRCSSVRTAAVTQVISRPFYVDEWGNGLAGKSVFIFGGQLEIGSSVGPYLSTTGTALADQPSTGDTLYTDGWTPSTAGILMPGDKFKLAGGNKVHEISEQVDSDAWGNATLPIYPPLNRTPTDNESLVVAGVSYTVRHAGQRIGYDRSRNLYTLELDLIEDVR